MKKIITYFFMLLFMCFLIVISGCSSIVTKTAYRDNMIKEIKNNNYVGAAIALENSKKDFAKKDRVLYYLYHGMILHYLAIRENDSILKPEKIDPDKITETSIYNDGMNLYEKSNIELEKAELAIEELYTQSIARGISTALLNDNARAYGGEDYESIYINVFKALNYLGLDDIDGAAVEIRKVNNTLKFLQDKYEHEIKQSNEMDNSYIKASATNKFFNNSALAHYLSMLLYNLEGYEDDAQIDLKQISEAYRLQSNIYNFKKPNLDHVLVNDKDKTKLNVFSFTGFAPVKTPLEYKIITSNGVMTIYGGDNKKEIIESFNVPIHRTYTAGFAIPLMEEIPSKISKIEIKVDGKKIGNLDKIESINNIAKTNFKAKESGYYSRAIARTIGKLIAQLAADEAADKLKEKDEDDDGNQHYGALSLLGDIMSVATRVSAMMEYADLRSCIIFPHTAFVGNYSVTPGLHNIDVLFYNKSGIVISSRKYNSVDCQKGKFNYIEAVCNK